MLIQNKKKKEFFSGNGGGERLKKPQALGALSLVNSETLMIK